MTTNDLILPDTASISVTAHVAAFGANGVETGGFLLAPRGADAVSTVAVAGRAGIVRRRDVFQVSAMALDQLFAHADEHRLWIPAQFHSHDREAFMSPADIEHGLSVPGFISMIVPYFASPPTRPAAWGWWRYDAGWKPVAPPRTRTNLRIDTVTFDEDGVRGS